MDQEIYFPGRSGAQPERDGQHDGGRPEFPYSGCGKSERCHYNRTLLCWKENFQKHRDEVVKMFDEKICQNVGTVSVRPARLRSMNGIIDLHQILFTNDVNNDLPMTRWY